MKKTKAAARSEATRRLRRRVSDESTGLAPVPAGFTPSTPEPLAVWQQLKAVEGAVAPRYRRD